MNTLVVVWLLVHYGNNMGLGPEFKNAELCERAAAWCVVNKLGPLGAMLNL